MTYAGLKAAGVAVLGWGQFLTVVINFIILAFIIFLIVRSGEQAEAQAGRGRARTRIRKRSLLLREIRDALKNRG